MEFSSEAETGIRLASEADLPALTAIFNAAITQTLSTGYLFPLTVEERREWWRVHLDPRYPILVADRAGEILGYASLSLWLPTPLYARTVEASLYLAPQAQGRGLGTRLMRELLAEAGRLGHHIVISRVWAQNAASLALCRKCGFETVGVQREVGFRDGQWLDCVVMQVRSTDPYQVRSTEPCTA